MKKPDEDASAKKHIKYIAKQLDFLYPGWERHVNLETLNMGDLGDCIIGQLYPSPLANPYWIEKCNVLGLNETYLCSGQHEELWVDQVLKRRSKADNIVEKEVPQDIVIRMLP